jgi:hypothetical protein
MNRRLFPFFPVICVGLMAVGCASPQTFDVNVTNRLSDPITVWMTKAKPATDGNYEPGWTPPEALAVGTTGSERLGGVAIEPGETAHTRLTGHIANDDVAVLRVYHAADLNLILAMQPANPGRLDVPLDPGTTDLDIVTRDGHLIDLPHHLATH